MNILNIIGGFVFLLIGVIAIIYLIKKPILKENDTNKHMLQGYLGALGFIVLGLVLIINEIK